MGKLGNIGDMGDIFIYHRCVYIIRGTMNLLETNFNLDSLLESFFAAHLASEYDRDEFDDEMLINEIVEYARIIVDTKETLENRFVGFEYDNTFYFYVECLSAIGIKEFYKYASFEEFKAAITERYECDDENRISYETVYGSDLPSIF